MIEPGMLIALVVCDQGYKHVWYAQTKVYEWNLTVPGYYGYLFSRLVYILERDMNVDLSRGAWYGSISKPVF